MRAIALAAAGVLALAGTAPRSGAQTASQPGSQAGQHGVMVKSQDVQWRPGPPSMPQGARMAVLYGDPSKEGPFAMRLQFPTGSRIPPHTHPGHEIVTVISGTFLLGHGAQADKEKTQAMPAGSLIAVPPGTAHYAFVDEETVVQVTTSGPWTVNYVNPADAPGR